MDVVVYVTRQRNGWSVELGRVVRSGHADRETAVQRAHRIAAEVRARGETACVRIQEDQGLWREERSFAPKS